LKRCKPMWWDKWGLLQKVTTRGTFVSGSNTGISAYKHKDTTSKEIRPTSQQVYSFTHKKISPGIKWSALTYILYILVYIHIYIYMYIYIYILFCIFLLLCNVFFCASTVNSPISQVSAPNVGSIHNGS
jgi:hypothetical protein